MKLIIDKEIKSYKPIGSLAKYKDLLTIMQENYCVYNKIIVGDNHITIIIEPQKIVLDEIDMNTLMYEYFSKIMVNLPTLSYIALGGAGCDFSMRMD
jgi:hypothetical protein